jgi:hypothetical protein
MKVTILGEKLQGLFAIRTRAGMFVYMKLSVLVRGSWLVITISHFYSNLGVKKVKLLFFSVVHDKEEKNVNFCTLTRDKI